MVPVPLRLRVHSLRLRTHLALWVLPSGCSRVRTATPRGARPRQGARTVRLSAPPQPQPPQAASPTRAAGLPQEAAQEPEAAMAESRLLILHGGHTPGRGETSPQRQGHNLDGEVATRPRPRNRTSTAMAWRSEGTPCLGSVTTPRHAAVTEWSVRETP